MKGGILKNYVKIHPKTENSNKFFLNTRESRNFALPYTKKDFKRYNIGDSILLTINQMSKLNWIETVKMVMQAETMQINLSKSIWEKLVFSRTLKFSVKMLKTLLSVING